MTQRLLFVVQRYGAEVAGGAEALTRMLATRLVARGHQISVLTSCALGYQTWEDHFPGGTATEDGVVVHRLPVVRPRRPEVFGQLSARTMQLPPPAEPVQRAWMVEQGPLLDGFRPTLRRLAAEHDAVAFMTYLYATTSLGLAHVAPFVPTILHPTAHDELPMRIPLIRENFDHAAGLAYSTPEERELVERRFRPPGIGRVIGIGFDPPPSRDGDRFRGRFGLGTDPYLLFLGRIDQNKAADEAIDLVLRYRHLRGSDLRLVLVGQPAMPIPDDPGIVATGFVDDDTRWDAIDGCIALLQPSYQESFSMVLAEAALAGKPGLVQERCDVLAGFARRSGGALTYRGATDFMSCVEVILEDAAVGPELGALGQAFVQDQFTWPAVLDRYESLITASIERFAEASSSSTRR